MDRRSWVMGLILGVLACGESEGDRPAQPDGSGGLAAGAAGSNNGGHAGAGGHGASAGLGGTGGGIGLPETGGSEGGLTGGSGGSGGMQSCCDALRRDAPTKPPPTNMYFDAAATACDAAVAAGEEKAAVQAAIRVELRGAATPPYCY